MQKVKECNVFRVLLKRYLHLLLYITVLILNTYLYIERKSFYKHYVIETISASYNHERGTLF